MRIAVTCCTRFIAAWTRRRPPSLDTSTSSSRPAFTAIVCRDAVTPRPVVLSANDASACTIAQNGSSATHFRTHAFRSARPCSEPTAAATAARYCRRDDHTGNAAYAPSGAGNVDERRPTRARSAQSAPHDSGALSATRRPPRGSSRNRHATRAEPPIVAAAASLAGADPREPTAAGGAGVPNSATGEVTDFRTSSGESWLTVHIGLMMRSPPPVLSRSSSVSPGGYYEGPAVSRNFEGKLGTWQVGKLIRFGAEILRPPPRRGSSWLCLVDRQLPIV